MEQPLKFDWQKRTADLFLCKRKNDLFCTEKFWQMEELKQALEVLKKGGVILYPTETIWGLGCDATSQTAVHALLDMKQRTKEKGMIVLVSNSYMLEQYVEKVPEMAWQLMEVSDEPLTIVYPAARNLPAILLPEDGTVAVRITRHRLCIELINRLRKPIVSTSANYAGQSFPESFAAVPEEIKNKAGFCFNPALNKTGNLRPSSVIRVGLNGEIKILRK
jgi:L-threonylcarbamoyladenylate synthase